MTRRNFAKTALGAAGAGWGAAALSAENPGTATGASAGDALPPDVSLTHPSSRGAYLDYPLPDPQEHEKIRAQAAEERAKDPRPNILWVFTDQQTWNALSCAGNPHVYTPNMDRIAQRGMRFVNCDCASPVCGPSRGAMVTGRMPHETGVHHNGQTPDPAIPTMGEVFREAGYDTWWSGKWHLPDSYVRDSTEMRGFRNVRLPGGLKVRGLGDSTDMLLTGDAVFLLNWHLGLSAKPWLYTVSLHNPHDICWHCVKDRPEPRNVDQLPPLPANHKRLPDEPSYITDERDGGQLAHTHDWTEAEWRAYLQAYYSMTESVDRCVGDILDALEDGGWDDNTLVIFTSDHGEGVAAHEWVCKLSLYEEAIRVPMIMAFPGKIQEDAVDEETLTSTLDIFPTMCDYAGITPPEKQRGVSLRPVLEGRGKLTRDAVISHLAPYGGEKTRQARMVRTADYKYNVYNGGENPEEFFDLKNDPGETRNLADEPTAAKEKARHRKILEDWLKETEDPFQPAV